MDTTSKGLGSIVGGAIFLPNNDHSIVLMVVAVTAVFVGTAVLVSSFFRFVARHTFKA